MQQKQAGPSPVEVFDGLEIKAEAGRGDRRGVRYSAALTASDVAQPLRKPLCFVERRSVHTVTGLNLNHCAVSACFSG